MKKVLAILLTAVLMTAFAPAALAANNGVTVTVASAGEYEIGDTATVEITLSGSALSKGVSCIELELGYDPKCLQLLNGTNEEGALQLTIKAPDGWENISRSKNEGSVEIRLCMTEKNSKPVTAASQFKVTVNFKVLQGKGGGVPVTVKKGTLDVYDANLNSVTAKSVNASINVKTIRGDFNGDGDVTSDDAIYLLRHTLFPENYLISQSGDVNGDGKSNSDDAIYLLRYTLFPGEYVLY